MICPNCIWFIGWREIENREYGYCTFCDQWIEYETAMNETLECDAYYNDRNVDITKKP